MRSLTIAALCLLPLGAQPESPLFRTSTRLVEVSLLAWDRNGKPVTDLKQDELTLLDNGQPRPAAFFRYEGAPPAQLSWSLPPGVYTNTTMYTAGPSRAVTAILLDSVNTAPEVQARARTQVMQYLKAGRPDSLVALFHLGARLTVLHDFTDDAESLHARLTAAANELPSQEIIDTKSGSSGASMALNASVQRNRLLATLSALETLAQHLAGISARKNLVWISSGFQLDTVMGPDSLTNAVDRTARKLAQNGVALYFADPAGLQVESQGAADPRLATTMLTSVTGGRVIQSNDPSDAVRRTMEDSRGSYSIAFYAPEDADGKWHTLKLQTSRPGVRLVHRQGYTATVPVERPQSWKDAEWRVAVGNPIGSSAIQLTARVVPQNDGMLAIEARIEPISIHFRHADNRMHADLEVCLAQIGADGRTSLHPQAAKIRLTPEGWKAIQARGIPFNHLWKPAPWLTKVRLVVRDTRTDLTGTLDVPVKRD